MLRLSIEKDTETRASCSDEFELEGRWVTIGSGSSNAQSVAAFRKDGQQDEVLVEKHRRLFRNSARFRVTRQEKKAFLIARCIDNCPNGNVV